MLPSINYLSSKEQIMYSEMFKSFSEQAEKNLAPYVKFNHLFTKNIEEIAELQLAAVRAYSDLGLTQLKSISEIKDIQSLTAYNTQQIESLTKLSQQLIDDSNKFSAIAQEFKSDVEELAAENMKQGVTA